MAEDQAGTEGAETTGADQFDPKTLSPEAQEHMRREIQAQSDSKAEAKTTAEMTRFRAEKAKSARSATEAAEENELVQLADSGQHEALGQRVAARLARRSVEERVITDTSDIIERQIADQFAETLGPEKVEEVRQKTIKDGGAHAEFALGLAKAADTTARTEEIAVEVKAQLAEARGEKRDAVAGADKASGGGQGTKLSTFDEVELAYTRGEVGLKVYEEALKARDQGK